VGLAVGGIICYFAWIGVSNIKVCCAFEIFNSDSDNLPVLFNS
jgi:hypothetical protein